VAVGAYWNPYSVSEDRMIFTMKFLCKLDDERETSQALVEACNEMSASFADANEDTLWA
jgi:hypothetical protein